MIVFLTLIYIAVLFVLLKTGIIKMNTWWKISPLAWMTLLFVVLFLPMQWGAPGGTVNTYQPVIEIIPNVTGEVTEVTAKPLTVLQEGDILFKIEPRPFQAKVDQLEANLKLVKLNLERAQTLYKKKAVSKYDVDVLIAEEAQIIAQLDQANYDLESTIVRAPSSGFVVALTLHPGQRVGSLPVRSFMSFVKIERNKVIIGINQYSLRHIQIGQTAEVTFKLKPGKVFTAKVEDIALITPEGQLAPSGTIVLAPTAQNIPQPYAVVLKLDQDVFKDIDLPILHNIQALPAGAFGTGAIYTQSVEATHIIRKIMIRMDAWMNYIIPT